MAVEALTPNCAQVSVATEACLTGKHQQRLHVHHSELSLGGIIICPTRSSDRQNQNIAPGGLGSVSKPIMHVKPASFATCFNSCFVKWMVSLRSTFTKKAKSFGMILPFIEKLEGLIRGATFLLPSLKCHRRPNRAAFWEKIVTFKLSYGFRREPPCHSFSDPGRQISEARESSTYA